MASKKKILEKLPFREADPELVKDALSILVAEKHLTELGEVLVLSVTNCSYRNSSRFKWGNENKWVPFYRWDTCRFFAMKDDYISLLHTIEGEKWVTTSPEWLEITRSYTDEADLIRETFESWGRGKNLYEYQESISRERRIRKYAEDIRYISSDMGKFSKKLPKGFEKFEKNLFLDSHYLFLNKEQGNVYCSFCGSDFEADNGFKVNKTAKCPHCGHEFKVRSVKTSNLNNDCIKWSLLMEKTDEGEILFRYFRHVLQLYDYKNPVISRIELQRSVISPSKWEIYERGDFKQLGVVDWRPPIQRPYFFCTSEWNEPESVTVYNKPSSVRKMLKDTQWQYSAAELIIPQTKEHPYVLEKYIGRYPKIDAEKLLKCGFTRLANELVLNRMDTSSLDIKPRSVVEQLGVSRSAYRLLAKHPEEVTIPKLSIMKSFEKIQSRTPSAAEWEALLSMSQDSYYGTVPANARTLMELSVYATIPKIAKYLKAQNARVSDYKDYVEWLTELKLDTKSEFLLFPKSFIAAHGQRHIEVLNYRDKEEKKKQAAFNRKLKKAKAQFEKELMESRQYADKLQTKSYFIRLPENLSELDREGTELHHCVATYKEKVAEGKTQIFFIRKTEEPDKPFYTLEWRDDQVIQCRGYRNISYETEPNVRALVETFTRMMLTRKPRIKAVAN